MTAVPAPRCTRADERFVTGHVARVCEEQERTRDQRYVEDVITCAAEHLFGEDHRESYCDSNLPQRGVNRHDERDDESRYEESFCYLLMLDLRYDELDAQTHCISDDDKRQYS